MQRESISEKKIARTVRISRVNGWSVAGFAGLCAVGVLLVGDLFGFSVGVAVALSGWMELKGSRNLQRGIPSAFGWLVGSQAYLMVVLWCYAIHNLLNFDSSDPWARFSPGFKELILSIHPDVYLVEDILRVTYLATYVALILAVLIYQGGLCVYYYSRKKYLYPAQE